MTEETSAGREAVVRDIATMYAAGMSIRDIAAATNRSYSGVHAVLKAAGVTFRPRGGRRPVSPR